jgi:hypothetical protein
MKTTANEPKVIYELPDKIVNTLIQYYDGHICINNPIVNITIESHKITAMTEGEIVYTLYTQNMAVIIYKDMDRISIQYL